VGLTNHPHLPVHFFNADDTLADPADAGTANPNQNQKTNAMKKKLIALLAALSLKPQFANAEAPTDGETETALDLINEKVVAFANTTKTIKQKLLGLCKKVGIEFANEEAITDPAATLVQVEERVTKLDSDLTAARTQFANERKARTTREVGLALKDGRITGAEQPDWERRLGVEAQFANELDALTKLTPKVKTASVITLTHGGRERQVDISDTQARTQFINEVCGAIAIEGKLDPVRDSKKILNLCQQRHPALFKDVPHVEIKMPNGKK
jgi:hypothetical protein